MYEKKKEEQETPSYSGTSRPDHKVGAATGAGIGAGVGAAAGAAIATGAATGAAAGSMAGPPGAAVGGIAGAAIGGIVGALAGDYAAQKINPTEEEDYWRTNFSTRDYVDENDQFETYRPAYRYGMDSYVRHAGRPYSEVESQMQSEWEGALSTTADLPTWERAKFAVRDAYDRLSNRNR